MIFYKKESVENEGKIIKTVLFLIRKNSLYDLWKTSPCFTQLYPLSKPLISYISWTSLYNETVKNNTFSERVWCKKEVRIRKAKVLIGTAVKCAMYLNSPLVKTKCPRDWLHRVLDELCIRQYWPSVTPGWFVLEYALHNTLLNYASSGGWDKHVSPHRLNRAFGLAGWGKHGP